MAEETKTLRHTAEEIDDAIDKLPSNGNAAGIYKSSLSFSSIVNDGNVTQRPPNRNKFYLCGMEIR